MNKEEHSALLQAVRSRSLTYHPHAVRRMGEKRISQDEVKASLSYGSIVEAHNDNNGELRLLVRGKVRGDFVCSVVSLTTNEIVTVYRNRAGDHHQTLDKSAYKWTANLTELI